MKILLSGAHGFVGSHLCHFLSTAGHDVIQLVRKFPKSSKEIFWDYTKEIINSEELEGFDAVIHLAGESITSGLWTSKRKKSIYASRIDSTQFLVKILNQLKKKPEVFLSASAVGFYGNRGDEALDEFSKSGIGFLPEVVRNWEKAAGEFQGRSAFARFGAIVGLKGGILAKLLPLFRFGLGMLIGDGSNHFPWIALDDVIYALHHILIKPSLSGPINVVSPKILTQKEFMLRLAKHLRRPLLIKIPKGFMEIVLGEMSTLFTSSERVNPHKLLENQMIFSYENLVDAIDHQLSI